VFDTKLGEGKAGNGTGDTFSFAKIKDSTIGKDRILLDNKIFKALDAGALSPDAFANGKTTKSKDVHILYQNGSIRYDADGGGGKDAILFAKVGSGLAIDADDFLVM
jgi:serralysin